MDLATLMSLLSQQQQGPQEPDPAQFYQGLGQQIDAQQPYQEPVPQGLNPFAAMGSVFSGTLADMLGAQGAQRNAQERIQMREQLPIEAKLRNEQRRADLMHQKELAHLDLKIKIADAKQKAASKAKEDLKAQQAEADKNKFELAKMKLEQAHEDAAAQRSQDTQLKVAEIYAHGKPEDTQAKTQAVSDRALQAFNVGLDRIRGSRGTKQSPEGTMKTERVGGKSLGPLQFGGEKRSTYTPGGAKRIQEYASAAAGGKDPAVARAALMAYLDTIRDPATGALNKNAPGYARFNSLFPIVLPDEESQRAFLMEAGLLGQ